MKSKEEGLIELVKLYDYREDMTTRDEGDYQDICGQIEGIKFMLEIDFE
jgi:hypothetical protein